MAAVLREVVDAAPSQGTLPYLRGILVGLGRSASGRDSASATAGDDDGSDR